MVPHEVDACPLTVVIWRVISGGYSLGGPKKAIYRLQGSPPEK